jgi:hypothetical protein
MWQTSFHHSNAAMTRLQIHNSFHLIRMFQICTDNELQLQIFNDSLRLHLKYTVEHGRLFNGRIFHLITVSETAAADTDGKCVYRDCSILSQINPAHILTLFLYFLFLIVPFYLLRPFVVLNKKTPRPLSFYAL